MADTTKGVLLVKESDYVKVQDADGVVQEHPVPKAWVGTSVLPDGWKAVGKSGSSSAQADPDAVPAKSSSREDLEAYAVNKAGMSEEDAKAFANKDELHAALVAAKDSGFDES